MDPKEQVIVALDVPTMAEAEDLCQRVSGLVDRFKVGLELFAAEGPAVVKMVQKYGKVMLDLKMHDIPETVLRATKRAVDLGADFMTVHIAGGGNMLDAAVSGVGSSSTKILGVTVLTSMNHQDLEDTCVSGTVEGVVLQRAKLAMDRGLYGVVASVHEARAVKKLAPELAIVTPGIRPPGGEVGDQKRVATAGEAKLAGASYVVVGRPVRDATNPRAVIDCIIAEMRTAVS